MIGEDFGVYLQWRRPELNVERSEVEEVRAHAETVIFWLFPKCMGPIPAGASLQRFVECLTMDCAVNLKASSERIKAQKCFRV